MDRYTLALYDAPGGLQLDRFTDELDSLTIVYDQSGPASVEAHAALPIGRQFRLYDRAGTPQLLISDTGIPIWGGRLEGAAPRGGQLDLTAYGPRRALEDVPYTALWSSTSVASFRPVLTTDIASRFPDRFVFDTQNRLFLSPVKGSNQGAGIVGTITSETPDRTTRQIIGAQFVYALLLPVGWTGYCSTFNSAFGGGAVRWSLAGTGALLTGAVHVTFTGVDRLAFEIAGSGAVGAFAPESGDQYLRITGLRFVSSTTDRVNTTLTLARTNGAGVTVTVGSTAGMYVGMQLVINSAAANSEMLTVTSITSATQFVATVVNAGAGYAIGTTVQGFKILTSEIAQALTTYVNGINSAQLQSVTTGAQATTLDQTDAVFEDRYPLAILNSLALKEGLQLGVNNDRILTLAPTGQSAQAWYVDASAVDIERWIDKIRNRRYAVYQSASGRTLRTADADNTPSQRRYSLIRSVPVGASNTTSSAVAGTIRDTALAETADPPPRAGLTVGALYDARGQRVPLWSVQPARGDTITIRNLPPALSSSIDQIRTFRVMTATITAERGEAATLTLEPDDPTPRLDVLLAQRGDI